MSVGDSAFFRRARSLTWITVCVLLLGCTRRTSSSGESLSQSSPDPRPARAGALLAPTLACPQGYTFQNGWCRPPAEGTPFGAVFGIMYSTWHCPFADGNPYGNPVIDTSEVLAGRQQFGAYGTWDWKSAPVDGHYCLSKRNDVLRKHAIQLRDAGIHFVYIDATNHPSADSRYADRPDQMITDPFKAILRVWSQIPGAPRVVPWAMVQDLPSPMIPWMMNELAQYPQMQLIKDGKPFFLYVSNSGSVPDQDLLNQLSPRYSSRAMWTLAAGGFSPGSWSFEAWCADRTGFVASQGTDLCNQYVTRGSDGGPEQISVSPAYASFIFSTPDQATPRFGGRTFAKQFQTVYRNPTVKFVTFSDWNSWVAIDFCLRPDGTISDRASECLPGTHAFVDTYTDELSRDIEPTVSQGDYTYRLMKACIANFARGLPCDENSASAVSPMSYGSSPADAAQRACTYPGETNSPGPLPGEVQGYVDPIQVINNRSVLKGWACTVGSNSPTDLHVYLGGPAGQGGTFKGAFRTSAPAESAVHQICQNDARVPNRFEIDVTDWIATDAGARIYVHALNPQNYRNYFISQSGHCAVPWPETISGEYPAPAPEVIPPASYPMGSAVSNDVLWEARRASDGNVGSIYSSQEFSTQQNDRGTFLAAWLVGGPKTVSKVLLTARMQNRMPLGFATRYRVYLTAPDNSQWEYMGDFDAQVDAKGVATIQLPSSHLTFGVVIAPTVLGQDDNGNYFFQLAEIGLAQ